MNLQDDILTVKHIEINTNLNELCVASKKLADATAKLCSVMAAARAGVANKEALVIKSTEDLNIKISEYNQSRDRIFKIKLVNPLNLL